MKQPEVPIKNTVIDLLLHGISLDDMNTVAETVKNIGDCIREMPLSSGMPAHAFRGVTIRVSEQNPLEYTVFVTEAYRPSGAQSETRVNSMYRTRGHMLLDAQNQPIAAFGMPERLQRKPAYEVPREAEIVAYRS